MNQLPNQPPQEIPTSGIPDMPDELQLKSQIRYANTAEGRLAARDEDVLRRHILDTTDGNDHDAKRIKLLQASSATLSLNPQISEPGSRVAPATRAMQLGLIAWPVLVCMQQSLEVSNHPNLRGRHQERLTKSLTQAFLQALTPNIHYLRIEGLLNLQAVMGLSPLAIRSELQRESKKISDTIKNTKAPEEGKRIFTGRELTTLNSPVGPHLPVAFLLVAHVGWDYATPVPSLKPGPNAEVARMQSLWDGYFTHALPSPFPNRPHAKEMVFPTVRLGEPQFLFDAATQAQWMQLAWMAEHARKNGFSYALRKEQLGSFLTWSASVVDNCDDERAAIQYSYDGFWQPESHIDLIHQRVGLAQGTGRMCSQCLVDSMGH